MVGCDVAGIHGSLKHDAEKMRQLLKARRGFRTISAAAQLAVAAQNSIAKAGGVVRQQIRVLPELVSRLGCPHNRSSTRKEGILGYG